MKKIKIRDKKLPNLIVILGPTAAGKSDVAVRLAKAFNGEIVSADSRQVYKSTNIGTGKITKKEMKSIPHYLISKVPLGKEFNAALYKEEALKIITKIHKKNKLPILVGGTGLYVRAIVDNIDFPKTAPNKKLRETLEKKSAEKLFAIYKKLDKAGADIIDKKNKRRLVRAIEVCKSTGEPFWKQRKQNEPLFNALQIGIKLPKKILKKKISKRVEKMFKLGLEKEAKKLIAKYGWSTPLQTIGYQEWKEYFKGNIGKAEVKNLIITHTIQFAKRQMTWFKKDKRVKWVKNYEKAERLIRNFRK